MNISLVYEELVKMWHERERDGDKHFITCASNAGLWYIGETKFREPMKDIATETYNRGLSVGQRLHFPISISCTKYHFKVTDESLFLINVLKYSLQFEVTDDILDE